LVESWPRHRVGLAGLAAAPALVVVMLGAAFPGQGLMPFPAFDFLSRVAVLVGAIIVVPSRERALRAGVWLYLALTTVSFFVASPVGDNITRLAECIAAPLAACVLWPHRRRLFALAIVPLALLQWQPAFASFIADGRDPSTHAEYFTSLVDFLVRHDSPAGRVEVVPTSLHWEAAYVAPSIPLARGWERQLDTADNPIFYVPHALTPASYRAWLANNGVRYVALPDVPLDYAGTQEGQLVRSGVPGLRLVWTNMHWHVYEVIGSTGVLSGPGRLVRMDGGQLVLDAFRPGTFTVRVRYDPRWVVTQGAGCASEAPGGWIDVATKRAGRVELALQLVGHTDTCSSGPGG